MSYVITTPLTTASGVRDVYITEERFALVATSGGIDVVDLIKGRVISSGTLPSEPRSVAADWRTPSGRLYVGTSTSGIFDMNYVLVRNEGSDFTDSLVQRFTTTTSPPVSSNQINDLDALQKQLLIGTSTGVDFIYNSSEYATRALVSGSNSVRLTSTGGGYWITASGATEGAVEANYNLLLTTGTNIITVDAEYSLSSTPSLPAVPPRDISISEKDGSPPVVAVATAGGAFVFEEVQGSESSASNKNVLVADVISVDFGRDSDFTGGCLYTASENELRLVALNTNTVSGTHTPEFGTRDQSLVTGTINIVRTAAAGICPPPS